ncbi:MAG: hypothetical protein R3C26_07025 [Calditrichia bacterium]
MTTPIHRRHLPTPVFAIEKPVVPTTTTLDISWKVQTDSFTVSGTDSLVSLKKTKHSYNITVRNTGTLTATNMCCGCAAGLGDQRGRYTELCD